jgi:peptidyl-prolyl cis-trans isomerase SurA
MAICVWLTVGVAAGASAQEPAEQAAAVAPDSTEVIDRIVAVVGDSAILYSEILETILQMGAMGEEIPEPDTPEFEPLARQTLANLVDSRILLQKAKEMDVQVPAEMLDAETERRFRETRNAFPTASDFEQAVTQSGRTLVQYRQWLRAQVRSQIMIDEFVRSSRGNLPPVVVSNEEVEAYYEENLVGQTRPATLSFEQVVIEPEPGEAANDSSLALTEQILAELRDGKDFEIAAREYSVDFSNRDQGGDLGWVRRSLLVPAFADAAWAARTGQPVGPVKTRFGYHIIRVDNVRGGERKIRHILIQPVIEETDFRRAGELALAVADSIRNGVSTVALAERHGVREVPVRFPEIELDQIQQFGQAYAEALAQPVPGSVVGPFQTEGFVPGRPVFAVVRVSSFQSEGAWDLDEIRDQVRDNLVNEKAYEQFLRELRNDVHVDIRL